MDYCKSAANMVYLKGVQVDSRWNIWHKEENKHLPSQYRIQNKGFEPNKVSVVVDKSYNNQLFEATSTTDEQLVVDSIKKFRLNMEQKRSFLINANHATM